VLHEWTSCREQTHENEFLQAGGVLFCTPCPVFGIGHNGQEELNKIIQMEVNNEKKNGI
jgi:hypothetical protein